MVEAALQPAVTAAAAGLAGVLVAEAGAQWAVRLDAAVFVLCMVSAPVVAESETVVH